MKKEYRYIIKNIKERVIIIKQISKKEIDKLISHGIIRNTNKGYVNSKGNHVGHYSTVHKQYIEDYYVDLLNKLK